ncbi:hypothetical protein [Geothrix alkalitolerans]|uniref:hypothetical protein n=1 Tax=Geothrix alkalitolerans TaxID=2922724 RepID=UPI001FAF0A14|nr:hypothetical protein [Geothrix alkalitolerans]
MPTAPSLLLDPELTRFLTGGLSINAGSASAAGVPSLCRAFGCRVDPGPGRLRLFFAGPQAVDLVRDATRSGALAVVFSEPPTHRTIQIKGQDARLEPLVDTDLACVTAYRAAFAQCLVFLGFTEGMVRTLLDCPDEALVGLSFTPSVLFNSTPGAQAGTPLTSAPTPPRAPGGP